jgi:hypothetical protein
MEAFGLWEGTALLWIQENLRGVLDPLVCLYTKLGDHGLVWIALCAVLLLFPRTRRAGLAHTDNRPDFAEPGVHRENPLEPPKDKAQG